MKTSIKYTVITAIVLFAVMGVLPFKVARANTSVFTTRPIIGIATTTPPFNSFLKYGVSTTTTVVLDSYAAGTQSALDSASIAIQLMSSTTPPTLKWRYEYSQDAIDWYSEDVELNTNATTTIHVRDFKEHSWLFASSTAGTSGQLAGTTEFATSSRALKLVNVPTPTRYVRAVFYLASGSADARLFYQWIAKNQK
jgi:ABC-type phosphate transport system substrate-binding protein